MLKNLCFAATTVLLCTAALADDQHPHIELSTDFGQITLELDGQKAPISTADFLEYVKAGFYNNTQFHRVIPGFMVQGGGFTRDMAEKPTQAPIKNEADNGLHNVRGTLAMARTQDPNSATAQFFINVKDNDFLDHGGRDFGYAVFGKVTQGMDVVDQIVNAPTSTRSGMQNVPSNPIMINSAKRID
ncbi:peptidylprolyl isomerase [Pseudomonas typographi]|uniref:peptidylprolyl isomerase n=1 Tax=Pseudomonas typographi TaxID=2715964 RepID=UPI0016843FE6|nr:peptidylprolyl isomerase [Pseudomonas typographi]MBD1586910.1 peptidylprolyl isomerase A [Pseudomonas typographi]